MKVIAAVQSRMNASRLPGKPLLEISGKPLIDHVLEQVSKCPGVDEVVVVCTDHLKDDHLKSYLEKKNIGWSDGPADDIVGRFHNAIEKFNADAVIRVWGDCPLIHPGVLGEMLTLFKQKGGFITNSEPRTFPCGLNAEIYSKEILAEIFNSTEDAFYREYPMEYIKAKRPEALTNFSYKDDASDIQLTIDYSEDIKVIESVLKNFVQTNRKWTVDQLVEFCRTHAVLLTNSKLSRNIEYKEDLKSRNLKYNGRTNE
jgi:spore coat polysaccharide biosynthesis protein SpsF (cytidylyltransferase family)